MFNTIINQNTENENNTAISATWPDYDLIKNFFFKLYSDTSGYLGITTITKGITKTSQFLTTELEKAVLYCNEQAINGSDVYFSLGLQHERLNTNSRGKSDTVYAIPGLWADIDIADEKAHSSSELPPNKEEALKIPAVLPFKPTIIIFSGHGLHIYFLFTEPWILSNEAERREAEKLLRGFQSLLRQEARRHGWKLDNTASLAQMLRVPCTFNYKDPENPKTVLILENNYDQHYTPQDFSECLPSRLVEHSQPSNYFNTSKRGYADDIIDNCSFMQHCRDNSRTLTEPEWYAMGTNLCHTIDGIQKIHELSRNYPGYSEQETNDKIEHAIRANAPHTCRHIQEDLMFQCPADGCGPLVVSPLSHATNSTVIAQRFIKEQEPIILENPEKVYEENILAYLAELKQRRPEVYDSFKNKLPKKVNLKTLNKRVSEKGEEIKKERLINANDDKDLKEFDDIFPNIPLKNLKVPEEYIVKTDGLYSINKAVDELISISLTPVVITHYIFNFDTREQKVGLAVYNQSRWLTIIVSRNTISSRTGIVSLPARGLQVTSETAKYMVDYLHKFEMVNRDIIPTSLAVSHLGWSNGSFLPGASGDLILDLEDNSAQIANGFRESGTLPIWREKISPLRLFIIARFIIAAAFASPLLPLLKQRVFVIHSWCRSKGGKTAATYAALSVWGDPDILRASFKDTHVAIERRAALYCNLPLVIDEKQVLEAHKYDQMEALIYQLTQGSSKGRGGKDGGFQPFNNWENICISSGEEPVTNNSSRGGMMNRLLEVFGEPIPEEQTAREVYSWVRDQHGTAGIAYIKKLIEYMEEQPDSLNDQFSLALNILEDAYPEGNLQYLVNIAIVMLGDYLSSVWVFGEDELIAWEGAKDMGLKVAQKVCSEYIADEATRAYEYILGWYSSNSNQFYADPNGRTFYGFIRQEEENDYLCIYPQVFDQAMHDGGFHSQKVKQDWVERGYLLYEEATDKTKRRLVKRLKDPYTKQVVGFVCVKLAKLVPDREPDINIHMPDNEIPF